MQKIPLIDPKRLLVGASSLGLALLATVLFVLPGSPSGNTTAAVLLQTPPLPGRALQVGVASGKLAPDFEISTPGGERIRLSELRGRPVVINFWATWCASCLSEMPEIKALQESRGLDAFSVLAINVGESRADALEFIDFLNAQFLYGLDSALTIADAYGVYGLPLSVFIDGSGVIQAVYRGHADRQRLEVFTDAAIKAQPPGDLPVVLRLLSTIPRERVLTVQANGAGSLTLVSRSLRCDSGYCARPGIEALTRTAGIASAKLEEKPGKEPKLLVRFEPGQIGSDEVVAKLVALLSTLDDPVYTTEFIVRHDQGS